MSSACTARAKWGVGCKRPVILSEHDTNLIIQQNSLVPNAYVQTNSRFIVESFHTDNYDLWTSSNSRPNSLNFAASRLTQEKFRVCQTTSRFSRRGRIC